MFRCRPSLQVTITGWKSLRGTVACDPRRDTTRSVGVIGNVQPKFVAQGIGTGIHKRVQRARVADELVINTLGVERPDERVESFLRDEIVRRPMANEKLRLIALRRFG